MDNTIYLLYTCDPWRSWSSMRLLIASTQFTKILNQICNEVKEGNMEFNNITDLSQLDIDYINNNLIYGFVQVISDGEVI